MLSEKYFLKDNICEKAKMIQSEIAKNKYLGVKIMHYNNLIIGKIKHCVLEANNRNFYATKHFSGYLTMIYTSKMINLIPSPVDQLQV